MYYRALLFATSLLAALLAGCSDPPAISVSCDRTRQDTYSVECGNNTGDGNTNSNSGVPPSANNVVLQAGCYQDMAVCSQAFPMSWLIEHCTVPYVCPVRDYDAGPEERVCLRQIDVECWDKYSN